MVEDDDALYTIGTLTELGYRVLAASSGSAALEVLEREGSVDLLFTDVIMPGGMNGRELADGSDAPPPGAARAVCDGLQPQCHHPSRPSRSGGAPDQQTLRAGSTERQVAGASGQLAAIKPIVDGASKRSSPPPPPGSARPGDSPGGVKGALGCFPRACRCDRHAAARHLTAEPSVTRCPVPPCFKFLLPAPPRHCAPRDRARHRPSSEDRTRQAAVIVDGLVSHVTVTDLHYALSGQRLSLVSLHSARGPDHSYL